MAIKKYKHDSETSFALGATIVADLLKIAPQSITRIFIRPTTKHGTDLNKIIQQAQKRHIETIESTKTFNILNAKDNCLLVAEFKKPNNQLSNDSVHIVLVNPSDSGNLGTIIRSAIAFGYHDLAIITPSVDPFDPKTIRASMGAIFHINVQQFASFEDYSQKYPRPGYAFILNPDAQELSDCAKPTEAYSLIFGNEASGLPEGFCARHEVTPIFIKQSPQVDSLNLSIAASIAMHHFSA